MSNRTEQNYEMKHKYTTYTSNTNIKSMYTVYNHHYVRLLRQSSKQQTDKPGLALKAQCNTTEKKFSCLPTDLQERRGSKPDIPPVALPYFICLFFFFFFFFFFALAHPLSIPHPHPWPLTHGTFYCLTISSSEKAVGWNAPLSQIHLAGSDIFCSAMQK